MQIEMLGLVWKVEMGLMIEKGKQITHTWRGASGTCTPTSFHLQPPCIGNFFSFSHPHVENDFILFILSQAQQHIALQKMVLRAGGVNLPGVGTGPTTTVETPTKLITADELMDNGEYEEILEDMGEEGEKFGECFIP
ncbi:Splicing factor U2af large subunit A [Camellia lanceoleosa]|uniref:Splicing factor U2af large subunit A n=1 Tax=Camellia lanceoleosa TaxID=1840588 RepID=A0ACC0IML8_9ERIC|nr:Splicing factor U2af large subunit A [Camellia lanceoleosa]